MHSHRSAIIGLGVLGLAAAGVSGQAFTIPWYSIDGGGGVSTGGTFRLTSTIGQADAGAPLTGNGFRLVGGFLASFGAPPCRADFNGDGLANSQDFFDFLSAFFASAPAADFNRDALINSQDFFDFLSAFFSCA